MHEKFKHGRVSDYARHSHKLVNRNRDKKGSGNENNHQVGDIKGRSSRDTIGVGECLMQSRDGTGGGLYIPGIK